MASEPKTIEVEPGGELDRLLDEAGRTPLRLVRAGESFRLNREENVEDIRASESPEPARAGTATSLGVRNDSDGEPPVASEAKDDPADRRPSPEQVARSIAGIRAAAGSWKDIDSEAFKAYIRERRRTSSRPPVRWPE